MEYELCGKCGKKVEVNKGGFVSVLVTSRETDEHFGGLPLVYQQYHPTCVEGELFKK